MKKKKLSKGLNKYQQGGLPIDLNQILSGLNTPYTDFMSQNPFLQNLTNPLPSSFFEWKDNLGVNTWNPVELKRKFEQYQQLKNFQSTTLPIGKAILSLDELSKRADLERTLGQKVDAYSLDDEVPQQAFKGYFKEGGIPDRYREMGFSKVNTPKRTPGHGSKSHAVVVKDGGEMNQQIMGYKDNSPYKDLPFQDFNTNTLTMQGVSRPILALPNVGQPRVMLPNSGIYSFPMANQIREIPLAQNGGLARGGTRKVAEYQEMLKAEGLYDGPVDGAWGPKTQRAYGEFTNRTKNLDVNRIRSFKSYLPIFGAARFQEGGQTKFNVDYSKMTEYERQRAVSDQENSNKEVLSEDGETRFVFKDGAWYVQAKNGLWYPSSDSQYVHPDTAMVRTKEGVEYTNTKSGTKSVLENIDFVSKYYRTDGSQGNPSGINTGELYSEYRYPRPDNYKKYDKDDDYLYDLYKLYQDSGELSVRESDFLKMNNVSAKQYENFKKRYKKEQESLYNEQFDKPEPKVYKEWMNGGNPKLNIMKNYQDGGGTTFEDQVYNLSPQQQEEYALELASYMEKVGEDKMKKFAPKEYSFLMNYVNKSSNGDPTKKKNPDYDIEAPELPEIEKRGERIYTVENESENNPYSKLQLQLAPSEELLYRAEIEEINKRLLQSMEPKVRRNIQLPTLNEGFRQILGQRLPYAMQGGKINLTGRFNPYSQMSAGSFKEGGITTAKSSLITDSDSHNKKKGSGASYSKNGPMGPRGYNYSTGRRDVQDYSVFNEYIATENLIPIQTEKDELIVLPTGDITPVMASKRHSRMGEDEVTDVTPEGSYILSAHGDVKIYKDEAQGLITEMGVKPYRLGYAQEKPTERTLADLMSGKKMSPAQLGAKVMKQFPIWKTNNIYEASANQENKVNRKPYLEGIIQLSELDRYRKGLVQPEQMRNGGSVMRRDFLPKAQTGLEVMLIGSALQALTGAIGAGQQKNDAIKAYNDVRNIANQSALTQSNMIGMGTAAGIASTLAQDPTVDYAQYDPSYLRQMQVTTPMALRDSMSNRAYVNRPNYMQFAPSFSAGVSAEQAGYASALKQAYDAEMSIFDRDRAEKNKMLQVLQRYQDKNLDSRIGAFNAMRLNRNQQLGNVGDRTQGMFDSRATIEANRSQTLASARLGQSAANQQAIRAYTQGINSAIGTGTLAYQNYLQNRQNNPSTTAPTNQPNSNEPPCIGGMKTYYDSYTGERFTIPC